MAKSSKIPISRVDKALKAKDSEISTWRIFKILAEFVEGFELLDEYDKAVSIFGSARCKLEDDVYKETSELAYKLSKAGVYDYHWWWSWCDGGSQ